MANWQRPILLGFLLISASACRSNQTVRLAIAAQQSPSQILTYLASDLGSFRSEGLAVEVEEFPGSGKALEALIGGSVDVVSGYHDQTLQLPDGAPAVTTFVAMTNGHLVALAVSPSPGGRPPQTIRQLEGRAIGVTTLGSSTHLWLDFVLSREGLRSGAVRAVAIGTAARAVAAMERGVVDAGVVSDFTVRTLAARYGNVTLLADSRTPEGAAALYGVKQYPGAVLFARSDWIASHRETVRALARSIANARTWVKSHSAEEVAARMPASHQGPDPGLYTEVIRGTMAMLTPDGRVTAEGAAAAARLAGGRRDPARSYTNDYLPQN